MAWFLVIYVATRNRTNVMHSFRMGAKPATSEADALDDSRIDSAALLCVD
jgi:hypothetical protein